MALRWLDSFDHYATAQVSNKYDSVAADGGSVGIEGSGRYQNRLFLRDGNTPGVVSKVFDNQATWIVGFALQIASYSGADKEILDILDTATTQLTLRYQNSTGKLYLSGPFGSAITSTALQVGVWYYCELKVTIGNTGSYQFRINEQVEFTGTSVDTQASGNAFANTIRLRSGGNSVTSQYRRFDDYYICDGVDSGISGCPNNDYLGDIRVQASFPNGNGNSSLFTGSDGNTTDNYLLVDETSPNSDTDYVESSVVNDKDTYAYQDVVVAAGTIYGVQVIPFARKTDAGTRQIVSVARNSTSESDGAVKTLLDQYAYFPSIFQARPSDGAQWTISDVNGAEFGQKVYS